MKILSFMSLLGLVFSLSAPVAHAKPRGGERLGQMKKMMDSLNLSDEQKAKLEAFREADKGKFKALREKRKAAREKLEAAFQKDAPESELRSAHEEVKLVRSEIGDFRFEKALAIRKVLTAEQRKKFHDMKTERKDKGPRGLKHRGGDPDDESDED